MHPLRHHLRRHPAYLAGLVLLVLLLPATWAVRSSHVRQVAASLPDRQSEEVTKALAHIGATFSALQRPLLRQAEALASVPVVIRSLRERARDPEKAVPATLIDYFASLDQPDRRSIELYDVTPRLLAWNGFSMPLDPAAATTRFLSNYQTSIARDGELRQALVVWWPVRDGPTVVGAVRVMELVGLEAPVQNQYLRDYNLENRWTRETGLPVTVTLGPGSTPVEAPRQGQTRVLQGADGTPLGRVEVQPPPAAALARETASRYDDVLAFWLTVLFFWVIAGLWRWYAAASEAGDRRSVAPHQRSPRFVVLAVAWWSVRFGLLALDVPGRWQQGKAPFSPLFDPSHLASSYGFGLMQSSGDLLLTALFGLMFALAFVRFCVPFRKKGYRLYRVRARLKERGRAGTAWTFWPVLITAVLVVLGLSVILSTMTHQVVLDSTFDFFSRKDLLPSNLLLVVFCTLLVLTVDVLLLCIGVIWMALWSMLHVWPFTWRRTVLLGAVVGTAALVVTAIYSLTDLARYLPPLVAAAFLTVSFGLAVFAMWGQLHGLDLFVLRRVLPATFLVTAMLYPMLYAGMDRQQRLQMADAVESFSEGKDPRVLFAIEEVLDEARDAPLSLALLARDSLSSDGQRQLDSLALETLRGSLLASLASYDVGITFFDDTDEPKGRYYETGRSVDPTTLDESDTFEFEILHQMYQESGAQDAMVVPVTGRREPDRFQYEGIAPVRAPEGAVRGWVMVRAEPQTLIRETGTPFPRVLLPAGSYSSVSSDMSLAEFRNGVLVRSTGRDFGRYRLPEAVEQQLATQQELWRVAEFDEREYRTFYRRQPAAPSREGYPTLGRTARQSVIAVRVPTINLFDHLYYLLRLTVAGLFIALPLYLLGLLLRYRAHLLPAPRARFRDRVLNAFMAVGVIAVGAVGFVGLRVVTGENERAIQHWLAEHLESVEQSLALDARREEMPYRVLERTRLDSLANRTGLDLNVYDGAWLDATSRPQLVRERLIDRRLPIGVYKTLYYDGFRLSYSREHVGTFAYTAGFQALPDEQGRPRFVLSVPTLPEQERLEEERARTVAYLFGALLLLVLAVMATASLLANALARPIARLRSGLQAVAQGRFERKLPVDSTDEIGELVQTFNEMQEQLAESRRKLARQERQLAWREMARQVAHEIKNPLTPMKLSVQHLQRAYEHEDEGATLSNRFSALFRRITTTLIDQIDTLARIANEFHTFARMPTRVFERLDLDGVVHEAVSLMQEESDVEIVVEDYGEPIIVEADREELRRSFINLIKNALQAIPEGNEGRVVVAAEVRTDRQSGERMAYGTVSDNGIGIDPEVQDHIFEPNFSTKTSGTGLGLAIVKKSVEEIHGTIGFETQEDVGTTFWVRLPLAD